MIGTTTLVPQRAERDCILCSIAMATGRPYEDVHAAGLASGAYKPDVGTDDAAGILRALGLSDRFEDGEPAGDFMEAERSAFYPPDRFRREFLWGRRALVTVPSLNGDAGFHTVFYDGSRVFDPSNLRRYDRFEDLMPEHVVLLRHATRRAASQGVRS